MWVGMCVGLWVGRGAEARAVPRSARQRRERFGRRGWRSDRKVCRGEAVLLLLWVLWLLWLFKHALGCFGKSYLPGRLYILFHHAQVLRRCLKSKPAWLYC